MGHLILEKADDPWKEKRALHSGIDELVNYSPYIQVMAHLFVRTSKIEFPCQDG